MSKPIKFCHDHTFVTGQYGFTECPYCKVADEAYNNGASSVEADIQLEIYKRRKLSHEHDFYKERYRAGKRLIFTLLIIYIVMILIFISKNII